MEFNDPNERDKVLGPLFASEAKADAAIFGPRKFTLKSTKVKLESSVKMMLQYTLDPVINMLAPAEAVTIPELSSPKPSVRSVNLEQSRLESKVTRATSKTIDLVSSAKVLSSREQHDKSHYTTKNFGQFVKPKSDILDHVMLQRAARGYLFDCEQNKAIVADDPWLQDVWGWVKGKPNTLPIS
jgi:WD repeat-containing protein mio